MTPIMSIPLSADEELIKKTLSGSEQKELDDEFKINIEAIMRFCLIDIADDLNKVVGGYFLEPPQGFYLPDKLEPVIVPSNMYYVRDKNKQNGYKLIQYDEIMRTNAPIYNNLKEVILKRFEHSPNNRILSPTPKLAYRAMHVIAAFVQERVHNFSTVNAKKKIHSANRYLKHIDYSKVAPEYHINNHEYATLTSYQIARYNRLMHDALDEFHEDLIGYVDTALGDTNDLIWEFLGLRNWHYHFTKMVNTSIIIERGEDHRIRQWSIEHEHEFR